jgi:hypothetical protein
MSTQISQLKIPPNTSSQQQLTDEQKQALLHVSQMMTDAEIARNEALVNKNPHLSKLLSQKPGPESKCGCGTDVYAEMYCCISSCGCGSNAAITISSTLGGLSTNQNFQPLTSTTFSGVVHGYVSQPFDFSSVYLTGQLDIQSIQSLIGVQLNIMLNIAPNLMTLTISEGSRVLGTLVATYKHDFDNINFNGSGTGIFYQK